MIDCGEGTQMQMRKYRIGFGKIEHIFISHLHGDHFFGLIGLVSTFAMLGRQKPLHIYAPQGLKEMVDIQLHHTQAHLEYDLVFHELSNREPGTVYEDDKVTVSTLPLAHRIYTNGFLFVEKPGLRKLNIDAVHRYREIETCDYYKIKKGHDYRMKDGRVIPNSELTLPPPKPASYAYCSDTAYHEALIPLIRGVDVMYHETTFQTDREELAARTGHSTAAQAATIARKAEVGKLIIGHFSSRYKDISGFVTEAQSIFPATVPAQEGKDVFTWGKV